MGGGFMWLIWVAVIVAIIFIVKTVINANSEQNKSETALEILEKRYAKGEINEAEFERRKKELEK